MGFYKYGRKTIQKRKELQQLFIGYMIFLSCSYLFLSFIPIFESTFGTFSFNVLYNTSLLNLHGVLFKALSLLIFLLTFTVTFIFLNLINSYLLNDFSIVISAGGLDKNIKDYQNSHFIYFVVKSNIFALIITHIVGLATDYVLNIFFKQIPFRPRHFLPNYFIIAGCILNIFFSFIAIDRIINKNFSNNVEFLRSYSVDEISKHSNVSFFLLFTFFKKAKSRLSIRLSSFNLSRKSFDFVSNLFSFMLITLVIFSTIFGFIAVNDSAEYTMKEAIGEHSYAITKQSMEQLIIRGYDMTDPQDFNQNQLINNSFFSEQTIIDILRDQKIKTTNLDDRIVLYQKLKISLSLDNITFYDMYVVGYNRSTFIPNFRNFALNNPSELSPEDSMLAIWNLVDNPLECSFVLDNYPFQVFRIASLIQDPFVKGNVIYVDLNLLTKSLGTTFQNKRNVIFIKNLEQSKVELLKSKLNSFGFSLIDMQEIIDRNTNSIHSLGLPLLLSDLPISLSFLILIQSYSNHIIYKRKSMLNKLKTLGAKGDFITDVIWNEIKALVIWGSIIGMALSIILVFGFLIPHFVISNTLIIIFIIFSSILFIIVLFQVKKVTKNFYNEFIFN